MVAPGLAVGTIYHSWPQATETALNTYIDIIYVHVCLGSRA